MGSPDGATECMGVTDAEEPGRNANFETLHQVTLTGAFFLQQTEVTQRQWLRRFPDNNPSEFDECGLDCPVETVNWWEAIAYANALSVADGLEPCYALSGCDPSLAGTGLECSTITIADPYAHANPYLCEGYRLPMEAEWEYSYRAGSTTAFYNGPVTYHSTQPLDENLDEIGWYGGNSGVDYEPGYDCTGWYSGSTVCGPHEVGLKLPNDWGLYDMAGNIHEWVWDVFTSYSTDPVEDPHGATAAGLHRLRGGAWPSIAIRTRAAAGGVLEVAVSTNYSGLRIARSVFPLHCYDDLNNEGEAATDCGGECRGCTRDDACSEDSDCHSNICAEDICQDGATGDYCDNSDHCIEIEDWCNETCLERTEGVSCGADEQCPGELYCAAGFCRDGSTGDPCNNTADCAETTDNCRAGTCQPREEGSQCDGGDPECPEPLFCSSEAICHDGGEGDSCAGGGGHDDCATPFYCGSIGVCEPDRGLADGCENDAQCESNQCSNGYCAPSGFAYIPAGTFCMGSPGGGGTDECPEGETEPGRSSNEGLHAVTLTQSFYMQATEVTQGQWLDHFPDNHPSQYDECGLNCPVEQVNWFEAVAYANSLSVSEGLEPCYTLVGCDPTEAGTTITCDEVTVSDSGAAGNPYHCEGYRLPTEAEWEYSYRAGTETAFYNGAITHTGVDPPDENLSAIGWFGGNSEVAYGSPTTCASYPGGPATCGTHEVGTRAPNSWGLYDMAGNVAEWVYDAYGGAYSQVPATNPLGSDNTQRVRRGGGFVNQADACRAADRGSSAPDDWNPGRGFRVARTLFPGHCTDGETNTGETDVDCGGDCRPCLVAAACSTDGDCATNNCSNDVCAIKGFSYIPPGTFCMGSPGGGGSTDCPDGTAELGRQDNEGPRHQVTLTRGFYMESTEVTQGQWLEHFENNPSVYTACGNDCPVDEANGWEAVAYVNALSVSQGLEPCYTLDGCDPSQAGTDIECANVAVSDPDAFGNAYLCEGYRLPTEAEWEYAYRAGTTTAFYTGDITHSDREPLDTNLDVIAWYGGNSGVSYEPGDDCTGWYSGSTVCGTHPVGEKQPNEWGLYDMSGNLWEWVWGGFENYSSATVVDPQGASAAVDTNRGGSFLNGASGPRASARYNRATGGRAHILGFRSARTLFPSHCEDGETSGSETGLDCGGDCRPCRLAASCSVDRDCGSEHCSNEHCAPEGFAYIPAGTFCMGSPDGATECMGVTSPEELGRSGIETPHQVTLTDGYFMQLTETTQSEWLQHFPDNNPSLFDDCGLDCPVDRVNWWEAVAYVNALSVSEGLEPCYALQGCDTDQAGIGIECSDVVISDSTASGNPYACEGYRLPTEAEWEYAYRAGTTTAFYHGDITNTEKTPLDSGLDEIGWYGGNAAVLYDDGFSCAGWFEGSDVCGTHKAADKRANDWGLFDMSGNVREWAWDWYESYPTDAVDDPLGGATGSWRVLRGGSVYSNASSCRAASRDFLSPTSRSGSIRPVRSLP